MMDYQAAYVCLREAILVAMVEPDHHEVKRILNAALDRAPAASDTPEEDCSRCGHALREHSMGGTCMEPGCRCDRRPEVIRGVFGRRRRRRAERDGR